MKNICDEEKNWDIKCCDFVFIWERKNCDKNSKPKIATTKKLNGDKFQKLKLWQNWNTQKVGKLKMLLNSNSNCTKLKTLNCDKAQKLKLW